MRSIIRDPLLHFIVLAGLLYAAVAVFAPAAEEGSDARRILVDRAALIEFIENRTSNFDADAVGAWLDERAPAQLRAIIDDYVSEEVRYREALALGLDANDYGIKQRLVQKMDYLDQTDPGLTDAQRQARLKAKYDVEIAPALEKKAAPGDSGP